MFKDRLSSKWGEARDIYYNDNSDISDINHFSGIIWASKVIGKLIKISMELCDKRNRALHGTTSEEKHRIQRGGQYIFSLIV